MENSCQFPKKKLLLTSENSSVSEIPENWVQRVSNVETYTQVFKTWMFFLQVEKL